MKLIFIDIWNLIKRDRLDNLMLPYPEQSMTNNVDVDDVIEELKKLGPFYNRLLLLVD